MQKAFFRNAFALIIAIATLLVRKQRFKIKREYAAAKKLSVFDYLQVIFAALWGSLFLHEIPTLLSIIRYVVIIGVAVIRWQKTLHGFRGGAK